MELFKDFLPMCDRGQFQQISSIDKSEFKDVSPFVAMKFMSAVKDSRYAEYHMLAINEVVNKKFWELKDHKELQLMLLAVCGTGKKQWHYFPGKNLTDSKVFKFIQKCFPTMKADDIEFFIELNTSEELIQLAKDSGMQDKELKKFCKDIKDIK